MYSDLPLSTGFIRAVFLQPIFLGLEKKYRLTAATLGIPEKLLAEPMALIPTADFHHWLARITAQTQDPAWIIEIAPYLTFHNMGYLGDWFLSSPDLALAFRRINYGTSCLQSGAVFHGEQSGKLIKWCYDNHFSQDQPRLSDSLRLAVLYTNTLRHYMGADYQPRHVELSGNACGHGRVERFFGCEVTWNAPTTKVWLDISVLEHGSETPFAVHRPMMLSNFQLDELLNMPQPQDTAKVMYEMVTYACYYGFPTLDFVATRFQVSRQQLQRRLHTLGWTFTNVTSYVLCNLAIKYMLRDMPISQIATELGYHNVQSFSKAFQRQRGMTPTQYKDKLLERNLAGLP